MPNPKNVNAYSQVWPNMVMTMEKKPEGYTLSFPALKDATKFRFTFYSYRNAVRNHARKSASKETMLECQELLPIIDNMKLIIRGQKNGTALIFVQPAKQIIDLQERDINNQLMEQMADLEDEEEEVFADPFDTSDLQGLPDSGLDVLGIKLR